MKTWVLTFFMLLLFVSSGFSQKKGYSPAFFRFTSIDGEVNLQGMFRQLNSTVNDFDEFQKSKFFSGGGKLNTTSYVWHPDFLMLELGGEYNPGTTQYNYLVNPDYSEVRALKGLNFKIILLNNKPVTLSAWANGSDTYSNREYLTDIRTITKRWGGSLNVRSKFLPLNLSYNNVTWDQNEVQTGRSWLTKHENFQASTSKSFTAFDNNELIYSYNTYFRQDANFIIANNITNNIRLNNTISLDKKRNYTFRSIIYDNNRKGSQAFHIFNSTQTFTMNLPKNFIIVANYNLYIQEQQFQKNRNNKVTTVIKHQLFASLNTSLQYEYVDIKQSFYHEKWNKIGGSIYYTKKIPKGLLNLSYNVSIMPRTMVTAPINIPVFNEAYILADGEITLLNKPYIDINTVVIKDVTGSIIYQRDFDYILLERGVFIEVQRIPGGQIPNNSTVYVDYISEPTGSYKYTVFANNISANISLFKRWLEIYYRGLFLDYKNVEKSNLLILNSIKQNTFGLMVRISFVELGAEYEDRNSTITPYELIRFYVKAQKRIKKFIFSLNGNYRNYDMVYEIINRQYTDISGMAAYEFKPQTKLELNVGYRKQRGPGINLDLLTARAEFNMVYRQIYITLGAELYRRDYLNDLYNFNGVYFQISRKF